MQSEKKVPMWSNYGNGWVYLIVAAIVVDGIAGYFVSWSSMYHSNYAALVHLLLIVTAFLIPRQELQKISKVGQIRVTLSVLIILAVGILLGVAGMKFGF